MYVRCFDHRILDLTGCNFNPDASQKPIVWPGVFHSRARRSYLWRWKGMYSLMPLLLFFVIWCWRVFLICGLIYRLWLVDVLASCWLFLAPVSMIAPVVRPVPPLIEAPAAACAAAVFFGYCLFVLFLLFFLLLLFLSLFWLLFLSLFCLLLLLLLFLCFLLLSSSLLWLLVAISTKQTLHLRPPLLFAATDPVLHFAAHTGRHIIFGPRYE